MKFSIKDFFSKCDQIGRTRLIPLEERLGNVTKNIQDRLNGVETTAQEGTTLDITFWNFTIL